MNKYKIQLTFAGRAYKTTVIADNAILARDMVRNSIKFESVELVGNADSKEFYDSDLFGFLKGLTKK